MPEPVTIFTGAALVSAMQEAFVSMACEEGVSRGVRAIGARLSLGVLDANHNIARAARVATLNASIYCLKKAESAAYDAAAAADPAARAAGRSPAGFGSAPYGRAARALSNLAVILRKTPPEKFMSSLPNGGHAAVEEALAGLLAAERGEVTAFSPTLIDAALAETIGAGGWGAPPAALSERFRDAGDGFASAFRASIGALIVDKEFDAFFRIWLVLRAEATNGAVAELLCKFENLTAFAGDRGAAAVAIAGGEKWLTCIEAQNERILELGGAIKEGVNRLEKKLDAIPEETAQFVINALGSDALNHIQQAGVREGAIIELARRIRADVPDYDAAIDELRNAVEIVVEVAKEGVRGTNLGEFVDDVLRRIAEKSDAGEFDAGAEIAELSFEVWRQHESARRAREIAAGIKILEAGIRQDRLRRNAHAAAKKIEEISRLVNGKDTDVFAELIKRTEEFFSAGRDRGVQVDLQIAREIAERCVETANSPDEKSSSRNILGAILNVLGDRGVGGALERAIEIYELALLDATRDRVPRNWAATQNNIGNVLKNLGIRSGDQNQLIEAISRFRLALEVRTINNDPVGWATTQTNLGSVLTILGAQGDKEKLLQAIEAFGGVLKIRTRERTPIKWAATNSDLANTYVKLGQFSGEMLYLQKSIEIYNEVLSVYRKDVFPFEWAGAQYNLGDVLSIVGEMFGNTTALINSISAYERALEVWTRDQVPFQWAQAHNSLAASQNILGSLTNDPNYLRGAVISYRKALEEWTRDRVPLPWAMTQNNLGNALKALGELGDDVALKEAISAYCLALEERTRERVPLDWAQSTENLCRAREDVFDRLTDREAAKIGYASLFADVEAVIVECE